MNFRLPTISLPGRQAGLFPRCCRLATLALLASLGVGALIVFLAEDSRELERQRRAGQLAAAHADAIVHQLYRGLSATDALVAHVRHSGEDQDAFEQMARSLLPHYPGISALQLAPGGVVRMSMPLAGHERAIGHNLLGDPKRNKEAFLAVQTRRLTLAGPFELVQGGLAVVGRQPIFTQGAPDRFWGFATALMRVDDLLASTRLSGMLAEGYHYTLSRLHPDTGKRQVFATSGPAALVRPVEHEFEVPNGRWTISLAPVDGWHSLAAMAYEIPLVVLISLLIAIVVYALARHPERLEEMVALRTREIEHANELLAREAGERVEAQELLEKSENRFRNLVESTSDWVWEVDENAVYTYASPKVRELLGYAPEEIIGRTPFDLMPPAEAQRVAQIFGPIVAARAPIQMLENVNLHKDGHEVRLETSGMPIFDAQGRFQGYRGIDRDVSQRKSAEERIRKLSRAVEQTANAVMITDVHGNIEYVNPKFSEITGYSMDEVLGRNPRFLKSGEQPPEVYQEMWEAIKADQSWYGEFHNRRKNGELFWCLQSVSSVRNEHGEVTHFVSVMEDISGRKLAESTIRRLAYYDALTGLPNRRLFNDRLEQAAANVQRSGRSLALLYLDIDRLKNVNDSLGHAVGDALLRAVGERIADAVRKEDTVGRLEGDEFAVMLVGVRDTKSTARIVENLAGALKRPFEALGHELYATFSIGVSVYPQDGLDLDQLHRNADIALHRAKQHGDSFRFFTSDMNAKVAEYLTLENHLRRAVDNHEFSLYLQPQAEIGSGRLAGAEALVRWRHPEHGAIATGQFIPLAEEIGLIVPIGEWMLREACRIAADWPLPQGPRRIAVNLSARQFRESHQLIQTVKRALTETGLPPERLELEITESSLMEHPDEAVATMQRLADMGVTIAIDDFGTGYSSLAYLKRMPIQILKIDGSFVHSIATEPQDRAIVTAVVALARELRLRVVAEGVETRAQLDCLRALGCDVIQGFLYGRPVEAPELRRMVEADALPRLWATTETIDR